MSNEGIEALRPVGKEHAIKEVVLTLFVKQSLSQLDRFDTLCDSSLGFHEYEGLVKKIIEFKEPNDSSSEVYVKTEQPGRRIIRFHKGKPVEIIQAINEEENDRYFISYHSLAYTRWADFKTRYFEVIAAVEAIEFNALIVAMSLHYVDEFDWKSTNLIPLKSIFMTGGVLIDDFFESQTSDFSMTLEKQQDDVSFLDRLSIKVSPTPPGRLIRVSHNLTVKMSDPVPMRELIGSGRTNYEYVLQVIHDYNKSTLKQLFTKPVLDLIKLS